VGISAKVPQQLLTLFRKIINRPPKNTVVRTMAVGSGVVANVAAEIVPQIEPVEELASVTSVIDRSKLPEP